MGFSPSLGVLVLGLPRKGRRVYCLGLHSAPSKKFIAIYMSIVAFTSHAVEGDTFDDPVGIPFNLDKACLIGKERATYVTELQGKIMNLIIVCNVIVGIGNIPGKVKIIHGIDTYFIEESAPVHGITLEVAFCLEP
jgi:hypothetical protein